MNPTKDTLRLELSNVVRKLQERYPSVQHTQYEDGQLMDLLIGDPTLREAMGDAYPNFMGPYFADFEIKLPNTKTENSYEVTQQFAFGKVDKKMHLFALERANVPNPSEVRQMADEFGQLINGGYMSCFVPISATTRHYDYQGAYAHSLVTVFSSWASPKGIHDLIKMNVLEYVKHGRKIAVSQR